MNANWSLNKTPLSISRANKTQKVEEKQQFFLSFFLILQNLFPPISSFLLLHNQIQTEVEKYSNLLKPNKIPKTEILPTNLKASLFCLHVSLTAITFLLNSTENFSI